MKMLYVKNEAIENLLYFKYIQTEIAPFDLKLDGNFCDEFYKYAMDILQYFKKIESQKQIDPISLYEEGIEKGDIEKFKVTIDDLKKPYARKETGQVQKIYLEHFYIHEIKFNFTFSSSPMLFREYSMNPALKFFIVLLSNLKNVNLKFDTYQLNREQLPLPIFLAQLNKNYIKQCYSHQQFLKIVASMGIFGNVGESVSNLSNAFRQMRNVRGPKDAFWSSLKLLNETLRAGISPFSSIAQSLKTSIVYFIQNENEQKDDDQFASDQLNEDLSMAGREITTFNSPLSLIDTQNKIWIRIISKEKKNYEEKKKIMQIQKEGEYNIRKEDITNDYFKRQQQQNHSALRHASTAIGQVLYFPSMIIKKLNSPWFEEQIVKAQKIRPPRFVSFRMELEPYNRQKARALQILNDINLNAFVTETIEKAYTFQLNSLILTGKRLICVQESRLLDKDLQQLDERNPESFKSWNILYKDIMNISTITYDIKNKRQITEEEFQQSVGIQDILDLDGEQADAPVMNQNSIILLLKILYQEVELPNDGSSEQATEQLGNTEVSQASSQKKKGIQSRHGLGFEGVEDLRIAQKDIKIRFNEIKIFQRFILQLDRRIKKTQMFFNIE